MTYMDAEHQKMLGLMAQQRLERAKKIGSGPSGILRRNKKKNAARKASQRMQNLQARRANPHGKKK